MMKSGSFNAGRRGKNPRGEKDPVSVFGKMKEGREMKGLSVDDARKSPEMALRWLFEGNEEFREGEEWKKGNAQQKPGAVVIYCSDARTSAEIVFGKGLNEIFGIRSAGNVVGTEAIASVEYAVAHLGVKLVVVLGHTQCGAVTAACKGGKPESPSLGKLLSNIEKEGNDVERSVRANVFKQIENLKNGSEIVRNAAAEGRIKIVGAIYHIESGKVELIG
ncbi:MAG: carbonic anhydrase [Candidatus Micrarchaeia archaeon]